MKRIVFLTIAIIACTKRNPEVCCETGDECLAVGFGSPQPCAVGVCVHNTCTDPGVCDGDEDCTSPSTCMNGTCVTIDASTPEAPPPDGQPPPEMTMIPGGMFLRGCNSALEDCSQHNDELPFAQITISAFLIDSTEVTQIAYQQCITAGSCTTPSNGFDPTNEAAYPVDGVTWQQAVDYCTFRNKRLPTEAEWEKAARGVGGHIYPWGDAVPNCTLAHYLDCTQGNTSAIVVGSRAGDSPFGLKDMGGNVSEWVADWYKSSGYDPVATTDPQGPATGTSKVIRGGGWGFGSLFLRVANRHFANPTFAGDQFGFRCAK